MYETFASIHHPKKNTTMGEPFAGSNGMAILLIATPPGNIIAMGWSIQRIFYFCKPAKKIYLVKASILFHFLH
jgi:hypothetical protein